MATRNKKGTTNPVLPKEETETEQSREALKSDFFDDLLFHAANYIYVRRKFFITLAVIILVVLFSGYGTIRFIQYKDNQRNEGLFKIEKVIYDSALTEAQQVEQALPLLDEFIQEYPGTEQNKIARFYRAGLYYKKSEFAISEQDLNSLLAELEVGSDLYVLASIYLANVLRDQNKVEEALDVLRKARSENMADIVMMEEAEIYMGNHQDDKAKETLEVILKDYPKSAYTSKAKQLLEML
ncbi:tetratricopeptide repeat protein [bacterium]|nr:tetratricopeptide repeat protein [bacterium]